MDQVHILAFGAHPDDVELGMAGVIAKHVLLGHSVGIVDLTAGEQATGGTLDQRLQEARQAGELLKLRFRESLGLPDRSFQVSNDIVLMLVRLIRKLRPLAVTSPYPGDRHPDHKKCAELVSEACFSAGLPKVEPDLEPWRPERHLHYFVNGIATPHILVDVTDTYKLKLEALSCYKSQFERNGTGASTPINNPNYLKGVESRDRFFGSIIGAIYAEGFVSATWLKAFGLLDGIGVG